MKIRAALSISRDFQFSLLLRPENVEKNISDEDGQTDSQTDGQWIFGKV